MSRIKIAQIGTSKNSHGSGIFPCICALPEYFEVVGYTLPENEREKFPDQMWPFEGYREMTLEEILNDPEITAVTVETEEIYLTKYATLAAQHGKHIHMEKPGGTDLTAFENLIRLVKAGGKVFHTGYMYRYNPYLMELLPRIKAGEFGEILSVEAQMNCYHPQEVRQWLEAFPGGMMFFLGCHLIDLILEIQGLPERVIPLNRCSGIDGVTADDMGMAVFEYKNGISFAKTSAVERGGYVRRQLVITGTKGTVEVRPLEFYGENGLYTQYRETNETGWGVNPIVHTTKDFDRYRTMMASFAAMVRGEMENSRTYDYELELYRTVLKACGAAV